MFLVVSIANVETFVISLVENYVDWSYCGTYFYISWNFVCVRSCSQLNIWSSFHGFWRCYCIVSLSWYRAITMDVLSRLICVVLFQLSLCDNREELPRSRRAALPLNNPQYQIFPRAQRRNYWEYSYEDFGGSYEEEERAWLDGDFGMRSSNYKQKVFSPHKSNRRQRNMKVKRFLSQEWRF